MVSPGALKNSLRVDGILYAFFMSGGVREQIRAELNSLSPTEAKVAARVLADPEAVVNLSVNELAALSGASVASVVRCSQSMGFAGFPELKIALARELTPAQEQLLGDVTASDDIATVVAKILGESAAALSDAVQSIDSVAVGELASLLSVSRRVLLAGVGTSAPVAADAAYRLATIGVDVISPADVHVQHVTARLLQPGDLCVAVSHTGATAETLSVAEAAHTAGATVAAITSFRESPLTALADVAVVAGSRETAFRVEAMASRLVHIAIVDALVVLVARAGAEQSADAAALASAVVRSHRI